MYFLVHCFISLSFAILLFNYLNSEFKNVSFYYMALRQLNAGKNNKRFIIIGLDGVPYSLIQKYISNGVMPNLRQLMDDSQFVQMQSSIPHVSSVAWSSIITGKNPGEHGIFGFTELDPESYQYRYTNFNDLKASPFWEGKKAVIINVPQTYPAKQLDGVLISGFIALELEKAVYPASLVSDLRKIKYRFDVNADLAHQSMDLFFQDLDITLNNRFNCIDFFWENEPWELFMPVFTETDRINHFLFEVFDNENHRYADIFKQFYQRIDRQIGKLISDTSDRDVIIVHSDHGFCKLDYEIYVDKLLEREGFLKYKTRPPKTVEDIDSEKSAAFVIDPGRIYINSRDRFPHGKISISDKVKVQDDLISFFSSEEFKSKKIVGKISLNEETFKGKYSKEGPDLVILGNKGFDLKGFGLEGLASKDSCYGKRIFSGMHTHDDAFIIYRGPEVLSAPYHIEKIASLVV